MMSALTPRQLGYLKSTLGSQCTQAEFDHFMDFCSGVGLDPRYRHAVPLLLYPNDRARRVVQPLVTIDGLRTLAARMRDYRPDEREAVITYVSDLENPQTNPLGIEKCEVTVYKQDDQGKWYPIKGVAFWEEFAPISGEGDKRRLPPGSFWTRMPRLMIMKCAEAQALRKGWPAQFSGVYVDAEFDRAIADEQRQDSEQKNPQPWDPGTQKPENLIFYLGPNGAPHTLGLDDVGAAVIQAAEQLDTRAGFDRLMAENRQGLRDYWHKRPTEAFSLKQHLEQIGKALDGVVEPDEVIKPKPALKTSAKSKTPAGPKRSGRTVQKSKPAPKRPSRLGVSSAKSNAGTPTTSRSQPSIAPKAAASTPPKSARSQTRASSRTASGFDKERTARVSRKSSTTAKPHKAQRAEPVR